MRRAERRSTGEPAAEPPRASAGHSRAGEPPAERSGDDVRRRGWFWHWNTLVTQFAPLIGLKGVGLLNSYTVWTDRRQDSPYQGYAFPSQQAEAAFYGEERLELITINKILIALDLIEIRKEMVTRVDEAGHRWRVPHNFYRVKDRPEGFSLTPEAVLRVVELAARDQAVYRYIRHIFSDRFAPIDRDNVWHQILPVVRQHATWQQLAQRVAEEEARASARTRAGHARRRQLQSPDLVTPSHPQVGHAERTSTSVDESNPGLQLDVAPSNNGPPSGVGESSSGSIASEPSTVGAGNDERRSSVAHSNRTYDQQRDTTTTTKPIDPEDDADAPAPLAAAPVISPIPPPELASSPLPEPSPEVVACYQAANGRPATPLERQLLGELESEFSEAARLQDAEPSQWLVAAIREAVSSGSSFVAPKRIREILARWVVEGSPGASRASRNSPELGDDPVRPGSPPNARALSRRGALSRVPAPDRATVPPGGSQRRGRLDAGETRPRPVSRLLSEAHHVIGPPSRGSDEALVALPPEVALRLAAALTAVLGIPIQVVTPSSGEATALQPNPTPSPTAPSGAPAVPAIRLPDGLTNYQLWAMAQELLQARLPPASFESWIRPAMLLGLSEDGDLILGAPSQAACRRLEGRLRPAVEAALSELLGRPVVIQTVVIQEWLSQRSLDLSPPGQNAPPASHG